MKIVLGIVLLTIMYLFGMGKLENIRLRDLSSLNSTSVVSSVTSANSSSSASSSISLVSIAITGAVNTPGTYKITLYLTLGDLLEKAGGVLETADSSCYNVDYIIDGTEKTLYIPSKSETNKVSINSGSEEDLDTLPAIGPSLASAITKYRSSNGSFKKIEDIMKVDGIGSGTFTKIRDYITLE
jgi:competence protein ComEA